jgi:hypothetical protein
VTNDFTGAITFQAVVRDELCAEDLTISPR